MSGRAAAEKIRRSGYNCNPASANMAVVSDSVENDKWAPWISVGVTIVAIAAIVAHLAWPGLKIDFVTVTLLVVACLPWMRGIVSSVDLPGGTSIKLVARQRAVAREQQETIDAVRAVATADKTVAPDEKQVKIYELASDYEELRAAMPSGHRRTQAMGRIARQILSYMPLEPYDPDPDLLSPEAGHRLVAYLSLVADPDLRQADELTRTLTEREGIPYNQSWALRALNRIVDTHGGETISKKAVAQLRGMRDGLRPGSDRQLMLADLVDRLS
jgi:hypothetical protein